MSPLSTISPTMSPTMSPIPIHFDTDPGVDDAMALLMLHRHPLARLVGVSTVFGNAPVQTTTFNALALCEKFGIEAPVARGASRPLVKPQPEFADFVHGANGLGDVPIEPARNKPLDPRPAHQLISDLARQYSGELVLVPVGPLTNLALALNHDPELTRHVKKVVLMGGAFGTHGHTGNVTPFAEANIANDPDAADQVMGADWDVTVIGLDVTHEILMDSAYLRALGEQGGVMGRYLYDISRFYENFYHARTGGGIFSHDPSAVACALDESLFTYRSGPIRVVTQGLSAGQTLQAADLAAVPPAAWAGRRAQRVAVGVDAPRVLAEYLALFASSELEAEGLSPKA
jgi:inosine-uridine nucleoside N-ribohydrolase